MAVKTLEEVLSSLSADEKKLFENTLSKNPELKEGWLRQDDYSRKTQALATEREKMQTDLDHAAKMQEWADRNVPIYDSLVEKGIVDKDTGEELWTAKQAELQRQLDEAKKAALAGGDMDPAELDRRVQAIVKDAGVLNPTEMKALVAEEARKLAGETFDTKYAEKEVHFNEKTIPFVSGFATSMAIGASKYERETGKPWTKEDHVAILQQMTASKNFDPYAAMEEYIKPHKQAKENEADFEKRVAEEVEKRAPRRSSDGMPGGGNEPVIPSGGEKGNLVKMLERDGGPTDFESLIMSKAVEGAKALATEGKA